MKEKTPISPVLNKLKIGDTVKYPLRRADSVETSIGRIQRKTKGTKNAKMFSYRTVDVPEKINGTTATVHYVEVTRVS